MAAHALRGQRSAGPSRPSALAVVMVAVGLVAAAAPGAVASWEGPWWSPTQGSWLETAHITPDDADEIGGSGNPSHYGVTFGASVAIDGDTLVAGTQTGYIADQGGVFEDGGDWAYIFERGAAGGWVQVAKLIPDDAHAGDTFAYSVDVDEDAGVVVVGDPGRSEGTNKIYIFERQADGSWEQTTTFHRTNAGSLGGGMFGYGVAVSGHTVVGGLATGVIGEDPMTYVFEKVDGAWQETAALVHAGGYVDVAGDRLVGLFGEFTSCIDQDPCAHTWVQVYDRVDGTWERGVILDPAGDHNRSLTLAAQVALSEDGRSVVIGSPVDCRVLGVHSQHRVEFDSPIGSMDAVTPCAGTAGAAWIYQVVDGAWTQVADIPNPEPGPSEHFGLSIDISGSLAVIGAHGDMHNGGQDAGAAYVYEDVGGLWVLQGKLRNHDGGPYGEGDFFGEAVGVSESTVVVGAPWDDQRRDGTPAPFDDEADLSPEVCEALGCSGYDEGENAGSIYVFESAIP